jgi:glutamate synthase (ferredoxin)
MPLKMKKFKTIKIYNIDCSACGRIAGVIAKKYGDTGFARQLI